MLFRSAIPRVADIWGVLGGSSKPFSAEDLRARYGDRDAFLARFAAAAKEAEAAGVLLPRDIEPLIAEASESWDAAVGGAG